MEKLHWLPVEQRITHKLTVLTFKIQRTSTPACLSQRIVARRAAHGRSARHPCRCCKCLSAGRRSPKEPSAVLHRQH